MAEATDEIVGLLLAAGFSRRFGSDKLLHPLADGTPIALESAKRLQRACRRCVAVLRPMQTGLHALLAAEGIEVHFSDAANLGMGRSLATAVSIASSAPGWLVALADMPFIQPETYTAVTAKLRSGAHIVAPSYQGLRGHPVGFSRDCLPALRALTGDHGARAMLERPHQSLVLFPTDDQGVIADVDAPEDLMRVTR